MVVQVKQGEPETPTEVLAEAIVSIAAGMKKLVSGRLKERTLYMLIADIAGLERKHLKPAKVK